MSDEWTYQINVSQKQSVWNNVYFFKNGNFVFMIYIDSFHHMKRVYEFKNEHHITGLPEEYFNCVKVCRDELLEKGWLIDD